MKKFISIVAFCIISFYSNAQKYFGLNQSNYSGTQGMMYNPAKIANSRNAFALELFSINALANNSVYNIKSDSALKGIFAYSNSGNNQNISLVAPMVEVRLPSFSMSVNDNLGLGFSTRVRIFNQLHNANANIFNIYSNVYNGANMAINDPVGFNYNIHALTDIGVSAAYKLIDCKPFKLTAGATIRKYNGAGYFNFNNAGIVGIYNQGPPENINISNINLHLATSAFDYSKVSNDFSNPTKAFNNLFGNSSPGKGIGFDLGGEIIFNNKEMQAARENRKNINIEKAYEPYWLKLGVSLLDLGSMKYNGVKYLNVKGAGNLRPDSISNNLQNVNDLKRYFKTQGFLLDSGTLNGVKSSLPSTLNIYADLGLTKNIFVSAAWMQNLVNQSSAAPFYYSQVTAAPRFESKVLEVSVPITYNTMSKDVKLGAAFRVGPLSFGSDDLGLLLKDSKGGNVYAALRLAINKKEKSKRKKDIIEDYIVIKKRNDISIDSTVINKTKNVFESHTDSVVINNNKTIIQNHVDTVVKVVERTMDRDNDGVIDAMDKCPDVKGIVSLNGCPDRDGDGIADDEDKCPDVKGVKENNGCPEIKKEVMQEVKKRINFAAKAIQFETGKSTLKSVSIAPLKEVVKILAEYKDYNLQIDGHTDNVGQPSSNLILSQQRADAVKAFLITNGIEADRLSAKGYGMSKPKVPNTSIINKAINRRVEMNMTLK